MKTGILLGIIAVTILGTMAVQSMMVQAGMSPIETIQVTSEDGVVDNNSFSQVVTAECPSSHPFLIGGSPIFAHERSFEGVPDSWVIQPSFDTSTNTYSVEGVVFSPGIRIFFNAIALCANFNFPMGVIGGALIQPDSATLVIAYGIANAIWLVPSVAGIGIAVYLTRNRLQKH